MANDKSKTLTRKQVDYGDRLAQAAQARLDEARARVESLTDQLAAAVKEVEEIESEVGILDIVLVPALKEAKVSLGTRGL